MEAVGSRQSPLSCHLSRCLGTEAPSLHARYALPRYCEPLRLPSRSGLPLPGLRLSSSSLPLSAFFPLYPAASHHPLRCWCSFLLLFKPLTPLFVFCPTPYYSPET